MADTQSTQNIDKDTSSEARAGDTTPQRAAPGAMAQLTTERGTTTIDDAVVLKIAALAAQEVEGVAQLGGALSGAIAGVVGRIRGSEHKTAGVGVEVGSRQAAVDVSLMTLYPATIHEVAESVRQNVIDRIQSLTGLEVVEVNIAVTDLVFPGGENDRESSDASFSRRVE